LKTTFIKCDLCSVEICDDKTRCAFAVHKRVINGKEYYFCCEVHANSFEKETRKKKK